MCRARCRAGARRGRLVKKEQPGEGRPGGSATGGSESPPTTDRGPARRPAPELLGSDRLRVRPGRLRRRVLAAVHRIAGPRPELVRILEPRMDGRALVVGRSHGCRRCGRRAAPPADAPSREDSRFDRRDTGRVRRAPIGARHRARLDRFTDRWGERRSREGARHGRWRRRRVDVGPAWPRRRRPWRHRVERHGWSVWRALLEPDHRGHADRRGGSRRRSETDQGPRLPQSCPRASASASTSPSPAPSSSASTRSLPISTRTGTCSREQESGFSPQS